LWIGICFTGWYRQCRSTRISPHDDYETSGRVQKVVYLFKKYQAEFRKVGLPEFLVMMTMNHQAVFRKYLI
jgi:predicted class III extradiol MEMO1 family dioxygenase